MSVIVAVHGIGQQLKGEESIRDDGLPNLRDRPGRVGAFLPETTTSSAPSTATFFVRRTRRVLTRHRHTTPRTSRTGNTAS